MKKSLFLRIFIISAVVILLVSTVMAAMFVSVKEQDIVDSICLLYTSLEPVGPGYRQGGEPGGGEKGLPADKKTGVDGDA